MSNDYYEKSYYPFSMRLSPAENKILEFRALKLKCSKAAALKFMLRSPADNPLFAVCLPVFKALQRFQSSKAALMSFAQALPEPLRASLEEQYINDLSSLISSIEELEIKAANPVK